MENPQIEIGEIDKPMLDVNHVCDRIASTLERFGANRFKSIGYRTLQGIMDAGAMGAEIIISGKVPGARARSWRFSSGYLKKSGDISENYVKRAYKVAKLKPGIVGIKVSIMPPDLVLPDKVFIRDNNIKPEVNVETIDENKKAKKKTEEETGVNDGDNKEKRTKTNTKEQD